MLIKKHISRHSPNHNTQPQTWFQSSLKPASLSQGARWHSAVTEAFPSNAESVLILLARHTNVFFSINCYLKASYSEDKNLLPGGCCGQKYCCQSWSTYVSRIAMLTGGSGVKGQPLNILEKKKRQCEEYIFPNIPGLEHKLVMIDCIRAFFYQKCNTPSITSKATAQQDTRR